MLPFDKFVMSKKIVPPITKRTFATVSPIPIFPYISI